MRTVATVIVHLLCLCWLAVGGILPLAHRPSLAPAACLLPVFVWLYALLSRVGRRTRTHGLWAVTVPGLFAAPDMAAQYTYRHPEALAGLGVIAWLWLSRWPGEALGLGGR